MPTPLPRLPRLPSTAAGQPSLDRHDPPDPLDDAAEPIWPASPGALFEPRASPPTMSAWSSRVAVVFAVAAAIAAGWFLLRPPPAPDVQLPYAEGASPATGPPSATAESGASGAEAEHSASSADGPAPGAASGDPTSSVADAASAGVVVHAAGAVVAPGVYRLTSPARIQDVVLAAGGLAPDADVDRVNLAAAVADGDRVYVPRIGQEVPVVAGGGTGATGSTAAGADEPIPPVDLNSADVDALDALPGVGPATATAIVAYREEHGPFGSVEELLEVRGIGEAKLDALRDLVVVG